MVVVSNVQIKSFNGCAYIAFLLDVYESVGHGIDGFKTHQ